MSKSNNDVKAPIYLHSDNYHMIQRIACYVRDINSFCIPLIKSLEFTDYTIKDIIRWCSVGGKNRLANDYFESVGATNSLFRKVAKTTFEDSFKEFPLFSEIANDWILNAHLDINEEGRVIMSEENKQKLCSVYIHNEQAARLYSLIQDICKQLNEFNKYYSEDVLDSFLSVNDSGRYEVVLNDYRMIEDNWVDECMLEMMNPRENGVTPDWQKQLNEEVKKRHTEEVEKSKKLFNLD